MRRFALAIALTTGCAPEPAAPRAPYLPEVYIDYRADRPEAILERRYRNWDWIPVCSSPCARTVRPDFEYRVGGEWLNPSRPFVLYAPTTITAHVGTRENRALGIIGMSVGIPVMFAGLILTLLGMKSDDDGGSGALWAGLGVLAAGGVTTFGSAAVISANRTTVDLRERTVAKLTFKF